MERNERRFMATVIDRRYKYVGWDLGDLRSMERRGRETGAEPKRGEMVV